MNEINQRIKNLRLQQGLTIAKFAEAIQVSPGNISDWEGGKKRSTPSAKALINIAEKFNISLDWLMTGKEIRLNNPNVLSENSKHNSFPTLSKEDQQILQTLAVRLAKK